MSLPAWVEITSALSTPTIAVVGIYIAFQNHQLAKRRRKDELFDRRYKFYQECVKWWLATQDGPEPETIDLIPIAQEAEFLFGEDVSNFIFSLEYKSHKGCPWFPDSDFTEPFARYLRFEDRSLMAKVKAQFGKLSILLPRKNPSTWDPLEGI